MKMTPVPFNFLARMKIDTIFEEIRSLYFPRWDRQREWTVVFGCDQQCRRNTGFCDSAVKTIYLDEQSLRNMSDAGRRAFLIHEICHDVGAASHNRKWAKRMEGSATRADELNEPEVAEIMRSDIYSYCEAGVLEDYSLHNVLDYIEELIGINASFDYHTVLRRIARYYGHSIAKVQRDFGAVIKDVMAGIA